MVNQAYLELTGRTTAEVLGTRLRDLVSTPDYEMAKPYLDHALTNSLPTSFTRLWKNSAGERKWINVAYVPVLGDDGKLLVILAQIAQVQDVKGLDDAFIERERLLRHLTDDTGRPILYVDRDLMLRFMNKPFQTWIGNLDPNLLGKHVSTFLPKNAYEYYLPFVHQCLLGQVQKVELLSLALVGPQRHIRMEFHPDVDADGRVIGVYIIG